MAIINIGHNMLYIGFFDIESDIQSGPAPYIFESDMEQ